ncbi:LysR family transcriptional regulator [Variovorax paradoxus]|jgi:DNA-binding transcriptional LysR family regulator|uniref:LysR family transcriptional regulator n=1 Tax=Variovorax paradoxus TaxID=34073 RepID=UPI003ED10C76
MTTFDLNLLRLFEVVMRTGSATLAADELGLTQPAVSSSIRKLREHFADPLFVFGSAGMVLTPKARRISSPILSALSHVKRATATHDFAPSATTKTFRISVSDFGQMLLLPDLVKSVSQEAPGLILETVDAPPREAARMMELGDIDIAVGPLGPFGDGFHRQEVFADRYVCLVRRVHPTIQGQISAREYLEAKHVIYKSRGEGDPGFEKELEALAYSHGLTQNVAMRLAYTLGLARLIARSDYITTVPSRLAALYENYPGLAVIPLEFFVSRYVLTLQWHGRVHRDPAHVWLRAKVLQALVPDRPPLSV